VTPVFPWRVRFHRGRIEASQCPFERIDVLVGNAEWLANLWILATVGDE